MTELEFSEIYNIDVNRLLNYFQRIKKLDSNSDELYIIAKFLNNQSIGGSIEDVYKVLSHYKNKLAPNETILNFALEWIRAHKIRLEYKKYLIRASYGDDLNLAVDDCIYLFFLQYDKYIRKLLKSEIEEFEISALYEIFFNPYDSQNIDLNVLLEKHKARIPTIIIDGTKINTNIFSLREGLAEIIQNDYKAVLVSRKNKSHKNGLKSFDFKKDEEKEKEFKGGLLERMIKTYCLNKKEIGRKEIENAISQFLSSYFKFGKFYEFDTFHERLIEKLAEYIYSGLGDNLKSRFPLNIIKDEVKTELNNFREIHRIKKLDGLAWINDLKPILTSMIVKFVDNLFENNIKKANDISNNRKISEVSITKDDKEIDFSSLFDLNLEEDEFRERLEQELAKTNLSIIEKRTIIRTKVQEFRNEKRKALINQK
ncbi:MAG: hypothetical protein ACTSVV_07825 [Promethearchaeota archaeon]